MSIPTQIRIIDPKSNPDQFPVPGDIYRGTDGYWYDCCPVCGIVASLKNHTVVEEPTGVLTVSPSVVCPCDRCGEKCKAHYFIIRNKIEYV